MKNKMCLLATALILTLSFVLLQTAVSAADFVDDKTILIEAEEYDDVGADEADTPLAQPMPATTMYYNAEDDCWDFYDGGHIGNTWRKGATAYYELDIPKTCTYKVGFRVSTRENITAVVHLAISTDGLVFTDLVDSKEIPDTFTMNPDAVDPFENYIDVEAEHDVELTAGHVTIKMTFTNYPDVDFFTLTSADGEPLITPSPVPTAAPEPTTTPESKIATIEPEETLAPKTPKSGCGSLLSLSVLAALLPAAALTGRKR